MNIFKKTVFVLAIVLSFCLSTAVLAEDPYGIDQTVDAVNSGGESAVLPRTVAGASSVPEITGNIVNIGLSLMGIVFFLLFLYSGFRWMIARGNAEDVNKAKEIMEAAIIGLIIILAAYAITSFVLNSLTKGPATVSSGPGNTPYCAPDVVAVCRGNALKLSCAAQCPKGLDSLADPACMNCDKASQADIIKATASCAVGNKCLLR